MAPKLIASDWRFLSSGVARVLRAPVQRHVMGPLITKQSRSSFAFCSYVSDLQDSANCQFTPVPNSGRAVLGHGPLSLACHPKILVNCASKSKKYVNGQIIRDLALSR